MATADELLDTPVQTSADQLLDQGGTATADHLLDQADKSQLGEDIAGGVKETVKDIAGKVMMPLRGYEAMGVGAAKLLSGSRPQEALATAAEATQPGFEPKGVAENVGSLVGGTVPLLAIPGSEGPAVLSKVKKLIQAAKVGGLFGAGFSTVESLEKHGTITMDDAEHIAISGTMNAVLGVGAEAILGPIFSRIFKRKVSTVEVKTPGVKTEPPITAQPEYTPSAAARVARKKTGGPADAVNEDLTNLVEVKQKIEQHGTETLSPETQATLNEINKEVDRLTKLDKTYTTKQMLKDIGQDTAEMTPAKAEEVITRASARDFTPAAMTDKGVVSSPDAAIHADLEIPKGSKLLDMGYVDQTGKFLTREEAAKAINPEYTPGDALHSPKLQDLKALGKMDQDKLRAVQMRMSSERNKLWHDKYEKLSGTVQENLAKAKADPAYKELDAIDAELHKLLKEKTLEAKVKANPDLGPEHFTTEEKSAMFGLGTEDIPEPKLKDLIPTLDTGTRGMIQGTPGQELDDLIAQHGLDVVQDNVIEGYTNKEGKFLTKEEVLGPTEIPTGTTVPERPRLLNQWATETAQAAKDLGYKTSDEALAWAEKSHHHLNDDYKLALQNKFQSLIKNEPKVVEPIKPPKAIVSATPIEVGESAPILKASEMMDAFNKELPPTAGVNSEVADVVDAVRDATIGKKPKVDLSRDFKTVQDDSDIKVVIHANEIITDNQIKIKADTAKSATVEKLKVPASVIQSSPNLPGTEMAPAFIPEYISGSSNFRLGWYSHVAKQTRTVLEGMGNAGKELATRIGLVDDAASIRANNFLYNFDRFITQIPRSKRIQAGMDLMDVLEGRKQSSNLLPEGMTEQVQKMFGTYADDAKAMDFYILRQDGTKVPWAERANFAPRMVKSEFIDGILRGDGVTLNRVKQYFLESKQATSEYNASQKVIALRRRYMERRYGHLERAREYDLPPEFYDRQGFSVIPEYVRAASHRLEEVRQFGQHDVKVIQLLDQIAGEGNDAVLARQIFDRYAGLEVSDEVHSRLIQGVKNLVTGMAIQLPSTITQIGQVLTPIHRATSPDLGLGLAKAYGRAAAALIKSFTSLGKEQAARAGQSFESVATEFLLDTYGGVKNKPFGKFAEKSLEWSGFSGEDSFWRRYSALLGRDHIKNELIPRILKDANNKYAVTELRRLGLNPSIVRAQGGLSDMELNLATKRFADQTQGAPNVLNLPLWWSSPNGRFLTQFHTFSVVIGKENYLLAKDMVKTGNINRLISMGVGTPLVGAGISFIKEDVLGLKPNDFTNDKQTDQIIRWYMNGTSFGVMADLMLSLTKGRSAFTGAVAQIPALGVLGGLGYDIYAATLHGDKKAAKRVAQKIPVVGRVLFQ